jgi:hypothetical protein
MRRSQQGIFGLEGVQLYAMAGLAAALLVAGIAIKYLDSKVDAANERTAQAQAALGKEEQSRKGFQAAAGECSESVTKLQAAAKERDALYAKGLAGSRAKTTAAEAQIAALLSVRRPEGMSECDAMKKELDDEIDRRAARR